MIFCAGSRGSYQARFLPSQKKTHSFFELSLPGFTNKHLRGSQGFLPGSILALQDKTPQNSKEIWAPKTVSQMGPRRLSLSFVFDFLCREQGFLPGSIFALQEKTPQNSREIWAPKTVSQMGPRRPSLSFFLDLLCREAQRPPTGGSAPPRVSRGVLEGFPRASMGVCQQVAIWVLKGFYLVSQGGSRGVARRFL